MSDLSEPRNVLAASAVEIREPIAGITDADSDEFVTVQEGLAQLAASVAAAVPAPEEVPSITGATEQEQIDSVIAALVALGVATDDR